MKTDYKLYCLLLLSALLFCANSLQAQMGKCKGKYLGNVIQNGTTSGAGINYTTYWNQATSENGSKWGSVEGTQGSYNFTTSDVAYNWAKNNNGMFKYHNMVWGAQTPGYVTSASTATLTAAVENYIKAVANHYNPLGGLKLIDVVNEPVKTALPGNYKAALTAGYQRDNPGGTDQYGWIIWPFQLARKYCPTAKLLINEYSIENDPNGALVTYAAMVNAVKNAPNLTDGQKNLIDGIGLQCHAFSIQTLSAANFKAALDKLFTLTNLPIHITEMDLDASPNETTQKNKYQELFPVAWEHPHVAGITLWGYVQGHTWRNGNGTTGAAGTDSGIMYATGAERPALSWIKQYMATQADLSGCPLPGTVGPGWGGTTNAAPTVSITAPANNATFTSPANVTITANAADADGTVSNVQFFNGTTLLSNDATAPYSFAWTSVAAGTYSITAKATDNTGAVTTSTAVSITVTAPVNIVPTVSITAPANNAAFTSPANVTITATAADADGTVSNVQFFNGTTLLSNDATAPYSFVWTGVAAGTYSLTAKATDNSGAVTTSTAVSIVVTAPVNQAPSVTITAPLTNTNFTALATVIISATASDVDGTVSSVQFFNGTTLLGNDVTSPYSFTWTGVAAGTYSLTAKATDNSGAITTSSSVTINVNPAVNNVAPTVSLTAPKGTDSFVAPASVLITAIASDSDGTVSNLQFFNGTTLLGSDATSPYSFNWTNVAAGAYSITAVATDNNGATTTSSAVSITVTVPANQAPTVSITAPANNAGFTAPASLTITATASDVDGTVSSVQFFSGTTLLGSDASSPYSFSWANVAAGAYSIIAKATDNSGAVTTSSAVSITVTTAPMGDIAGPDCGTKNTSGSYSLAAANKINATSYSWWYTGSVQSLIPVTGDPTKVTVNFGNSFSAGNLCIGVNYSVAPWFKQYCKALSVCAARMDLSFAEENSVNVAELSVAPNPSATEFMITVPKQVQSYSILNNLGVLVYTGTSLEEGESVSIGEQFPAGLYTLFIQYTTGAGETRKIQKVK